MKLVLDCRADSMWFSKLNDPTCDLASITEVMVDDRDGSIVLRIVPATPEFLTILTPLSRTPIPGTYRHER